MSYLVSLLGENEDIVFTARQHGWVLAKAVGLDVLIEAILVTVAVGLHFNSTAFYAGLGLAMLAPIAHIAWRVLEWRSRLFVVTNRRVIELSGVLNKRTGDSSLDKVNDVILTQSVWGRLFNFGDIEILTASNEGINMLRHIADPLVFKRHMLNQKEALLGQTPAHEASASSVPRLIEDLDALRQRGLLTDAEFQEKKRELLRRI